jgi:hypothetical protein
MYYINGHIYIYIYIQKMFSLIKQIEKINLFEQKILGCLAPHTPPEMATIILEFLDLYRLTIRTHNGRFEADVYLVKEIQQKMVIHRGVFSFECVLPVRIVEVSSTDCLGSSSTRLETCVNNGTPVNIRITIFLDGSAVVGIWGYCLSYLVSITNSWFCLLFYNPHD